MSQAKVANITNIASILTTLLPASWAALTALVVVKTGSEAYKNHKEY